MDKACPLTSPFLVSNRKLLVDVRTILVLMVRLVGFLLPTTILVCSTVRLVKARLPLLNGYANGCKSIVLICATSMFFMDQGGELYGNPDILNVLTNHHYQIHSTGTDSSHQNGPVECAHRVVVDHVCALLIGANINTKFWPYAFFITSVSTTHWR